MDKIVVYCDGGCRNNQSKENIGAWAYTLQYGDILKENSASSINTTNNRMELQACIEALKNIKIKNIKTIVYLDSNYVLQGITDWIHGWKNKGWKKSNKKPVENKDLWVELDNLKNDFSNICFLKVKGHSGETGNERVDELCNLAMDKLEMTHKNTSISPKYSNGTEVKIGDLVLDQDCDLCRVDQVYEGVNESPSDDILLCDIKFGTPFSYRALDIEYIVTRVS